MDEQSAAGLGPSQLRWVDRNLDQDPKKRVVRETRETVEPEYGRNYAPLLPPRD